MDSSASFKSAPPSQTYGTKYAPTDLLRTREALMLVSALVAFCAGAEEDTQSVGGRGTVTGSAKSRGHERARRSGAAATPWCCRYRERHMRWTPNRKSKTRMLKTGMYPTILRPSATKLGPLLPRCYGGPPTPTPDLPLSRRHPLPWPWHDMIITYIIGIMLSRGTMGQALGLYADKGFLSLLLLSVTENIFKPEQRVKGAPSSCSLQGRAQEITSTFRQRKGRVPSRTTWLRGAVNWQYKTRQIGWGVPHDDDIHDSTSPSGLTTARLGLYWNQLIVLQMQDWTAYLEAPEADQGQQPSQGPGQRTQAQQRCLPRDRHAQRHAQWLSNQRSGCHERFSGSLAHHVTMTIFGKKCRANQFRVKWKILWSEWHLFVTVNSTKCSHSCDMCSTGFSHQ